MQRSGNPAVRYGLIFGGIIGVLRLIGTVIQYGTGGRRAFAASAGGAGMGRGTIAFTCLSLLVGLVIYFLAGMFAARETGRTGSGAVSGLIAALIGGAIGLLITLIAVLTVPAADWYSVFTSAGAQNVHSPEAAKAGAVIAVMILALVGLLIGVGIGAGVGALGGLAGKGRYSGPVNSYQEAFYQSPPQGFSPPPPSGYPPAGGYPPQGSYPPPPGGYPSQSYPPQDDAQTRPPQYPNS
jgi:hypothetical protein